MSQPHETRPTFSWVVAPYRFLRAHQRASGASSGKRITTPASATAAPSQRLNAQRRNAGAHGPSRARVPVFECGTVWSPFAEGPFFNGTLVPRIQLAILKTSKIMSYFDWPRLARPRDLVGSLVWRGDDRATENFLSLPFGWAPLCERVPMLRMPDRPCPW